MNTKDRPDSMGAAGSRTVYAGTDPSAQIMQVVASNSMIPLGFYQNVDKDHLDWGALAQQWIQMREQWPQPAEDFIPSPPPPPSFSPTNESYAPSNAFDSPEQRLPYGTAQPSNMAVSATAEYEEQGEAPMEVEREEDAPVSSQPTLPVPAPRQTLVNPHATAAVASWQAKINQLYQIESSQVRSDLATVPVNQRGSARAGRSHATESKPSLQHGLMEREYKLAVSGPGEPVPTSLNDAMKDSYSSGSITMTEAKRKLLPAWIREGLEKMERDKQRQFEREQERKQWEEQQRRQRCAEDATLDTWSPVKHGASPAREHTPKPEGEDDPSPTHTPMSELAEDGTENTEINFEEVAAAVRAVLTDLLLDVTTSIIDSIASETLEKINKRKERKQAQSTQVKPGLATCTGGLGLGMYDDTDEEVDDEEDDDEQQQQPAGKGEASGSDLERDNSTDGDLSDSAVEQKLKDTIRRKQREFEASARQIELWINSLKQSAKETNEPKPTNSKQQLFCKPERDVYYSDEDDQDLDDEDEDGSGVSDGRDEPNTKLPGSSRPAGTSAGSVNGDGGANSSARSGSTRDGETQPVNDKLYASQQFAGRKRRDKRVSRFSMLQEPRGRPAASLNAQAMPIATTYKLGTLVYPEQPASARTRPGDAGKPLAPDATATARANQPLADQQLLLSMLRTGATEVTAGSQLPTTEQILKRYMLAIQPPTSAGTSEGRQRDQEMAATGEAKGKPPGHSQLEDSNAGASSSKASTLAYKGHGSEASHQQQHRERSEKGAWVADAGQHRAQHRGRDPHRHRSRSKSSRSYTRSPHSVSGSTRSRSSRSRSSRSRSRSSHHRHRSERSRHRRSHRRSRSHSRSRSRSDSRSRSRTRSRSRSSGRCRSPSSKYHSRRRH